MEILNIFCKIIFYLYMNQDIYEMKTISINKSWYLGDIFLSSLCFPVFPNINNVSF